MKIKGVLLRCVASLLVVGSISAHAATLNVVEGQLVGVQGVLAGGALYNVSFMDGTCNDLIVGCDAAGDAFIGPFSTNDADELLFELVQFYLQTFNTPEGAAFEHDPSSIRGCENPFYCEIRTPYTVNNGEIFSSGLIVILTTANIIVTETDITPATDFDWTTNDGAVLAIWELQPVPIPGAVWLFGSALLGIAGLKRKRRG